MLKSNFLKQTLNSSILFLLLPLLAFVGNDDDHYKVIEFQNIPEKVCDLSNKVNETSGIIYFDEAIWTFNDSGGKPEIYRIDKKSGEVIRTVVIGNAKNNDWEDITMDDEFIYIGELGNNWGNRKGLVIYKVSQKDIISGKTEVEAELIHISYADQVSFEKMNRAHNFDCEAVISYGDSLILFSKNWEDNRSRMYKVSKMPGTYKLNPRDSFFADGLITGADYNSETNDMVLIGYKEKLPFIFLINDFDGMSFASEQIFRINFPELYKSQTEGICWIDKNTVMVSSEETKIFAPSLFKIDINNIIKTSSEN